MSKKSKSYEIEGSKYSFDFDSDSKLVGIQKADNEGDFDNSYLNPNTSEFSNIAITDEALNAYNIAKYGSNKNGYEDTATQSTSSELDTLANSEPFGGMGFRIPLTDFFTPANLSLTKSKA